LNALFERTYTSLTPAAQRTFLLLCSWRVLIPEIAVEAVSLRPGNERFDVRNALDDLRRYSLIEEVVSKQDEEVFVGVPLAAAMYGRRKLEISPFKIAIEEDRRLLLEFGAGKREDAHHGVAPRINRFIKSVARTISEGRRTLEDTLPILEYLASRVPRVYVQLADLVLEIGSEHVERAKGYLRTYLETAPTYKKEEIWFKIADLCQLTNDTMGEVHALREAALLPTARTRDVSEIANRINSRIRMLKGQKVEEAWSEEVCLLLARVASAMEKHFDKLSATDCSRLAWLYLNIGNKERARDIAQKGLSRDPNDWHCQNLVEKLCV
jgi:tetratricopeptide (TPR) repeat protein